MANSKPITKVTVHMYKMGTGDCFVLKFYANDEITFKMLIDCGYWTRKRDEVSPFLDMLKQDVEDHVDVLVVTHEHTDHVSGFEAGKDKFTNGFTVENIWMSWIEKDGEPEVESWKKQYGDKKRALALAASRLTQDVSSEPFKRQFLDSRFADENLAFRQQFADVLSDFAALHVSGGEYVGGLAGMALVKNTIAKNNLCYFKPGQVLENIKGLDGVRIFVLGPPELWQSVEQETGEPGEAYEHNRDLQESDLFVHALEASGEIGEVQPRPTLYPFERHYMTDNETHKKSYTEEKNAWRRIDYDWLFASGAFALRINSLTNNLSLVLAFEFIESGKVLLFPGDAEIGSWKSWHKIDWKSKGFDTTTEKLLNRVVFYKVAHHLSHNGTARSIGLDMMTHPDLVAMATLNYDFISSGWKSTMPNRMIIRDLLEKTRGRTLIMNEDGLFYDFEGQVPLSDKIKEARTKMRDAERQRFEGALDGNSEFYLGYEIDVT